VREENKFAVWKPHGMLNIYYDYVSRCHTPRLTIGTSSDAKPCANNLRLASEAPTSTCKFNHRGINGIEGFIGFLKGTHCSNIQCFRFNSIMGAVLVSNRPHTAMLVQL